MSIYRVAALPLQWPGKPTAARAVGKFKENWGGTEKLLKRELEKLGAKDVVLHMDVQVHHLRQDGGVRADARPGPRVILAFTAKGERLSFPCDRFSWWQTNVRAIALALEALRAVDRYGVMVGRQYEGFKALGAGGAAGTPPTMAPAAAAEILAKYSALPADVIECNAEVANVAARLARVATHPDREHGDAVAFQAVEEAIGVLLKYQVAP